MTDIVERLRSHVSSRVGNQNYRLKGENAAWVMMEEAADEIEALRKDCLGYMDENPWQPIETALIDRKCLIGYWRTGRNHTERNWCVFSAVYRERKWVALPGQVEIIPQPTHWMPLPAPPQEAA